MPATDEQSLKLLKDMHALRLAYAASSDYVMQQSFNRIAELQAFRDKPTLAPQVLEQYEGLLPGVHDPVILGAHLYALELTGARAPIRKAVLDTLARRELRQDPLIAQSAGKIAARLVHRRLSPGQALDERTLDELRGVLGREVTP